MNSTRQQWDIHVLTEHLLQIKDKIKNGHHFTLITDTVTVSAEPV